MLTKNYNCNTTFLDLLFNMLFAFIACFILAFALIKTDESQSKKNTEIKADIIITMIWPKESNDDVDLWCEYEGKNLVFFGRKEDGFLHLERDDLGYINDTYRMPDGSTIEYRENREMVLVRNALPGEYVVNAHMFFKRDKLPIEISIIIEKLMPYKIVFKKTIIMSDNRQEITFCRFRVGNEGEILSVNELDKTLLPKQTLVPGLQGL